MKQTVYTKSVLRKVTQSLFLLLLIIFLSFAFILRATEYLVIQTQTNQVSGYYRAIGTLIPLNTQTDNVAKGAKLLAQNPYVGITDTRRSLSATLDGIYNADLSGVSSDLPQYPLNHNNVHISDVFVYGTLIDITQVRQTIQAYENDYFFKKLISAYYLTFQVDKVEAGYPEYAKAGETIGMYYHFFEDEVDKALYHTLKIGERYFVKAYYNPHLYENKTPIHNLTMKPLNNQGLWLMPVPTGKDVNYDLPELNGLREEIETQNENRRTVDVTTTKDMRAIPDFQESSVLYYLKAGRWLNHRDEIDNERVCVIRDELAKLRGLSIGDTLSLTFRNLKNPNVYGYITTTEFGDDVSHWREYPTHREDFEIVGLYSAYPSVYKLDSSSYHFNDMYVPFSSAPLEFGENISEELRSHEFSFVLKSPQDQDQFMVETRDDLAKLGLQAVFMDNNSSNFWASVKPLKQSAVINLAVFGVVFLLVLTLTVYIYLKSQMKNFAIMRALGMPKRLAISQMMKPMIWLGILGTLIGGSIAWNSTLQKSDELLLPIWEAVGIGTVQLLSPVWFVVLSVIVFSLLMVFLLIGMQYIGKKKVLELLQGATAVAAKNHPKDNRFTV